MMTTKMGERYSKEKIMKTFCLFDDDETVCFTICCKQYMYIKIGLSFHYQLISHTKYIFGQT
jgi:hypothetical protein